MGTTTSRQADARFLVRHPAHFIALGFGAGLVPKAPGTAGTLLAWGIAVLMHRYLPALAVAFVAIPLFFVGVWACDVTAKSLGKDDPGVIVWDEMVAFLPLAALASGTLLVQILAFVFFRLFDIWKPFPIREMERRLKGGLGIMFDDLVAAGYTYVALIFMLFFVIPALQST